MTSDLSIDTIEDKTVPTSYCALILTAIPIEYHSICEYIPNRETIQHPKGNFYECGKISFDGIEWKICVGQTGPHNPVAASETERAIDFFKPNIVFFVGVAGGLKDVKLGDIVISSKIYPYEYGKVSEGFKPRSDSRTPNYHLLNIAQKISRESDWKKRVKIELGQSSPKIYVGPIVSGEKVLSDEKSYEYELIKQNYSDANAAEMEGFGFLDTAWRNNGIDAIVIRGISDYCDKGKSEADKGGSQEIAAVNASAVTFEFLANYSKSRSLKNPRIAIYDTPKETPIIVNGIKPAQEPIKIETIELSTHQKSPVSLNIVDSPEDTPHKEEIDKIKQLVDSLQPDKALIAVASFKEKRWGSADKIEKYRVLGNEGLAEIQLGDTKKGALHLIEALSFNRDSEKAIENAAYGCLLNEDYGKAIEYSEKVIKSNPDSSNAYSVYVQSKAHFEPIEKIIPTIPEKIRYTQEVAGAIGQCFFNSGNFNDATTWFEIAVKEAKKDALLFKARYASSLLNKVKNDPKSLSGFQITQEMRQDLENAKRFFTEIIESISENLPMRQVHFGWYIERGITEHMMGKIAEASQDYTEAYNLNSTNPIAIYHKALSDCELEQFNEAEILSEKILWEESTPGSLWLYLHSLRCQKKNDEGIEKIGQFKEKITTQDQKNILDDFLISFYLAKGTPFYEKTESIARDRYEKDKTNTANSIELLKILQITHNDKELDNIIEEIGTNDLTNIPVLQQMELANIFYDAKHHTESSKIYARLVDPSENTNLTQKLISSLFFSGNHKDALDCCKKLHSRHGVQSYSSRIELAIYLEVGDLSEALRLCEQYLEKYPDDYEMKLNKARVDFRANNIAQVLLFLETPFDVDTLSYESGTKLARLFFAMYRYDEAIRLLYSIRNKFIENPNAHLDYIQLILDIADRSSLLNKPEKVQLDTVVQLEDNQKITTSYYFCSETTTDPLFAIKLSPASVLGAKINDATEGVKINFEAPVGENFVIVKNILTKYTFAFQESVNTFNQKFLGHPGIFKIPVGSGNDGHITKEDIENIRVLVERNQKKVDSVLNLYKKRRFTISGIAQELNRDIFTVCSTISHNPDTGIACCFYCTPEESDEAKQNLDTPLRLVIDPVALYTICSDLKFGDLIVKRFGKLIVSQSTVDLLRIFIINLSGISSHGFMSLSTSGDSIAGYQVTPEQITATKQHYEQFVKWVEQNCEIQPCYESLSLNSNKKQEYESLFGQATLDTMLLASHENTILYSDDGLVQGVAKELFNTKYVWSQILLLKLECENQSTTDILNETAITLIQQHHYPPIINGNILFNAVKKAQWHYGSPFTEVVQLLEDIRLKPAFSIKTGGDFVIKLWFERLDNSSRNYLLLKVLKAITRNRDKTIFCSAFVVYIAHNSELYDIEKMEIINLVFFYHDSLL